MTGSARNFLEFQDIPEAGLRSIIGRASELAKAWDERTMPQSLAGKRVALIVDDGGWRNTTAFDLGIQAMSGICAHVPIGFNAREDTGDLSGYLCNWFDMLVIRTKELATLKAVAAASPVPVINARTRSNHPCETLGDLAYIKQPARLDRQVEGRWRGGGRKYPALLGRSVDRVADRGGAGLSRTLAYK